MMILNPQCLVQEHGKGWQVVMTDASFVRFHRYVFLDRNKAEASVKSIHERKSPRGWLEINPVMWDRKSRMDITGLI